MENEARRSGNKSLREPHTPRQTRRSPLKETTNWVNSQPSPPGSPPPSSPHPISHLPHHTSLAPRGTLQVRNSSNTNLSPRHAGGKAEDKRVSEISSEATRSANRDSQISTSSTNASGKPRTKKSVGPWRLGATIGKGATGRVRKARHQFTGQDAAVKIISKKSAEMTKSASIMAMDTIAMRAQNTHGRKTIPFGIERECVIMKLIDHPNIISLYDVWENRGELYLVLEYVEGGELFHHIQSQRRLSEHEAVRIFRQIIAGLSYCHSFHICHRDLKPENILLDSDMNVKIVDFGMAALQPQHEWLQTSCGSPHYACPEVISQQPYRGDLADVWSAGVVLYAMLTGCLPFCSDLEEGEQNFAEVISKVLDCEYAFPEDVLSDEAEDFIIRVLQPDPNVRMRIRDMWKHPLFKKYENLDPVDANGNSYIGSAPHLSVIDCGPAMRYRSQIDNEILRNMRNLWHSVPEAELAQRLLSKEPNHERVLYVKLQQFQDRLLESYQSTQVDYSTSDYHHVTQPTRRTSLLLPILGGNVQHASRFSLLQPGPYVPKKDQSQSFHQRNTSIAKTEGTEESYDPFRASKTRIAKTTDADYARITVLRNASQASSRVPSSRVSSMRVVSKASMRNPVLDKLQEEDDMSVRSSSGRSSGYDRFHRRSSNQRQLSHGYSRVSIMSKDSATTTSTATVFRKSISYRRNVTFPHQQRRQLSGQAQRRLRSAGNQRSPLSLHQQFLQEQTGNANAVGSAQLKQAPISEETEYVTAPLSQLISPRKRPKQKASEPDQRFSQHLANDARKVSHELAQLCDATWNRESIVSGATDSTPATGLRDSQQSYASPATSISMNDVARTSMQSSGLRNSMTAPSREYRDRPLPPSPPEKPAGNDHLTPNTRNEIARTRDILRKRARDSSIPPGYLDEVIAHLDRLMQPSNVRLAEEQRRAISTPEQGEGMPRKDTFEKLTGYRATSEPTQKKNDHRMSTIRIVEDEVDYKGLSPIKPLAIRKKSSFSGPSSGSSTPTQQKLLVEDTRPAGSRMSGVQGLDAIHEEDKENFDPVTRNAFPGTIPKRRHWFHRHQQQPSRDTDIAPPVLPRNVERPRSDPQALPSMPQTKTQPEDKASQPKLSIKKSLLKLFSHKSKNQSQLKARSTDYDIDDSDGQVSDTSSSQRCNSRDRHHRNTSSSTILQHKAPNEKASRSSLSQPRAINPEPQNWLARLLGIKPATQVLCFQISKMRARREISGVFSSWKKYGMRDIVVDKATSRIWARVDVENSLKIPPMRLACEVHTVLFKGRKANMSIARFVQEKGARSSFNKVLEGLQQVLRSRGVLVEDAKVVEEVRTGVGL